MAVTVDRARAFPLRHSWVPCAEKNTFMRLKPKHNNKVYITYIIQIYIYNIYDFFYNLNDKFLLYIYKNINSLFAAPVPN